QRRKPWSLLATFALAKTVQSCSLSRWQLRFLVFRVANPLTVSNKNLPSRLTEFGLIDLQRNGDDKMTKKHRRPRLCILETAMTDRVEQLRKQILALTTEYHAAAFPAREFVPGTSTVPVSGKVIGADDIC